jgi:hypothetical protein
MMKRIIFAATFAVGILATSAAPASAVRCEVPMSEWQTQETLRDQVETEGWTVTRIKTDKGCYEVYATDGKGRRIEAYFDPKSLEMVQMEVED